MLVLSRRKDETIMVGDEIEITVVDVKGDTVRLGIAAPKSVSVHRKEIYEAIQAENIAAARHPLVPDAAAVGGLSALLKRPLVDAARASAAVKGGASGAGRSGRLPAAATLAGLSVGPAEAAAKPCPADNPADSDHPAGEASIPAAAEAQPVPGLTPGAAPVAAKSLAAMFKRKS